VRSWPIWLVNSFNRCRCSIDRVHNMTTANFKSAWKSALQTRVFQLECMRSGGKNQFGQPTLSRYGSVSKNEFQAIDATGIRTLQYSAICSLGAPVMESIRRVDDLPLDTHLTISEPKKRFRAFAIASCVAVADLVWLMSLMLSELSRLARQATASESRSVP
jgi:hypothetical protein